MNKPLYMVQLEPEPRALIRFLAGQGLNTRWDEDLGYGTHAWLRATFGQYAPQPFRLFDSTRKSGPTRLLAYGAADSDTLLSHATTFAEPAARSVCDLDRALTTAPMPGVEAWRPGRRLGFEVLLCPVAREARTARERDVFLRQAESAATTAEVCREEVYRDWLVERLGEAAFLEEASLGAFRLTEQLRRGPRRPGGPRPNARLIRPQALMRGILVVRDATGFADLLAHGIGRHRSFGYGMLLLRPAP